MLHQPPICPRCPDKPTLWKETTRTAPGCPDRWRWYCAGCKAEWEPSPRHKLRFTYGTPAGSAHAAR